MSLFELKGSQRTFHQFHITCRLGDISVRGATINISNKDFCLVVPTPRIKLCLLSMLNKDVILEVENVTIDGSFRWYTIENDNYCIGISINKWHIPTWKKLLSDTGRLMISQTMDPAQIRL